MTVYTVSAFSKDGSGGNRAGVVLQGGALTAEQKQEIAARLGCPETAFVSPSRRAGFRLEYFTPTGEVPLCGHATIGTFVALRELGRLDGAEHTIETKAGVLRIAARDGLVFMEQNAPAFAERPEAGEAEACFRGGAFDPALPVQIVSTGLRDILLPAATPEALAAMVPDFPQIARLSERYRCVGIHAFALTAGPGPDAVCRNFAPLYGIDEESATGTSSCALACYLHRYGRRQGRYRFEQGRSLGSVSEIQVEVEDGGGRITGVRVGGDGYLVGCQEMAV